MDRSPALRLSVSLLFLSSLALAPLGADEPFVYGLSHDGRLTVNGTVLDRLRTSFDSDNNSALSQRWDDLVVRGADRFALRRDGELYRNGKRLHRLPFSLAEPFEWVSLALGEGVFAIRQDGIIAVNGRAVIGLPLLGDNEFLFAFRQTLELDSDLFSLRADGALFKNASSTPLYRFRGPVGPGGLPDGREPATVWTTMAVDPLDGQIHALRANGLVFRADPKVTPPAGTIPGGVKVAELPFPATNPRPGDLYLEITFTADGHWKALRADGAVFGERNTLVPIVDYPGDGNDAERIYIDIATSGNEIFALRRDGRVFRGLGLQPILRLPRDPYGRLGLGGERPDLSNFRNQKPVGAIYNLVVVEGQSVTLPVIVTDADRRSSELVVEAGEPLPPGALWDPVSRVLSWEDVGPRGGHRFTAFVDDGRLRRPARLNYKIKVIPPDPREDRNRPPKPSRIKRLQALVGHELSFPVFATDPDGDEVTFSVDETRYPFSAGATFDTETDTFTWTPTFDDIGRTKVVFFLTDGSTNRRGVTRFKKLGVAIQVVSSLIFEELGS